MQFRHVDMIRRPDSKPGALLSTSSCLPIELVTVVDIKQGSTSAVYNVLGYNFNVVANNVIVSSHGEVTKNVPELMYKAGQFIYDWVGVQASRGFYRAIEALFF